MAGNIYTIAPTVSFVDSLAKGILDRFGSGGPLKLAEILILLPNRRSCRALREAFLNNSLGKSILLPKIRPIGDLDEEGIALLSEGSLGNLTLPISTLRRKIILTRLILEWSKNKTIKDKAEPISPDQAFCLAEEVAGFFDEMQREKIPLSELKNIVPDELAKHWQLTLDFFSIITEEWPQILEKENLTDPMHHRNVLIEELARVWQTKPPNYPVILAGSTGSTKATSILIKAISQLPQGYIVLPGLDKVSDNKYWDNLEKYHPQFGLKQILVLLKMERYQIQDWSEEKNKERFKLASEIMRPSAVINDWMNLNIKEEGLNGIKIIEQMI